MAVASKKRARKNTVKSVKKTVKRGAKVTKVIHESTKEIKVDKVLVDNFVALQKVMVNLSSKFDNLSTQISKLLELFDISAKALAKKDFDTSRELGGTEDIMRRLDNISQQAGLIGRGLELIHRVNEERRNFGEEERMTREEQTPSPSPQPKVQKPTPSPPQNMNVKPAQPKLQPPKIPPLPSTQNRPNPTQNKTPNP